MFDSKRMHNAEIGTVAKSLPLLRQRLINSSFKAILQIVAYFSEKARGFLYGFCKKSEVFYMGFIKKSEVFCMGFVKKSEVFCVGFAKKAAITH